MSGNRDELPERTGGDRQGSSRSRQQESQEHIAERLGIDPEQVATRDTLDRGVEQRLTGEGQQAAERSAAQRVAEQAGFIERDDVRANVDPETFAVEQRLTDEGTTEAEQRLAEQTAADQEFVRPADLEANVDPETFSAEATLTEEGREAAQQRQAEQLRQEAANQSDRFGASDFQVDRSGDEITVEPTEAAVDRERREQAAQQFESQSQFINNVDPQQVELTDGGAQLPDQIIEQAEARAQRQARQQAQQQRQEARQDFAQSIESGSAFGDLPDGVDPASLVDNIDPQSDIVREGDSLALADDVQGQINSQLESDALQQQRQEFAQALESGEAFESGEAPEGLGDVDPQSDIEIEDDQLTLADETQRELITSQLPDSATDPDTGALLPNVAERARSRTVPAGIDAIEEQLPEGVDVRSANTVGGEIRASQLDLSDASRETIQQLGIAPQVLEDRNRAAIGIGSLPSVRAGGELNADLDVSIDDNQQLQQAFRENAAEVIDDDLPGQQDISAADIGPGGELQAELDSLQVDGDEIGSDGLTDAGRDDLARQQLAEIQASESPISAATPADSQAFANVVAELGQELDDPSLTARQDVLADLPFGSGDTNTTPATELVSQIDPQEAASNEDIDLTAGQIRQAQQDIEAQQQQLESDPSAVLDEIADRPDDFVERATLLDTQNQQGRARRSAAREQINAAEEALGSGADLQLASDAQGIGDINDDARDAIQARVAEPLANFGGGDVNVAIDDGQIETSIDQSVLRRTRRNAIAIDEQQARNEIADANPNIDRGDIEVEAGEGVSPSDELVTETLGTDVNGDIESFDQLQQAAETQARFQARQKAIQQVESQTIGAIDPRNVTVERTESGFEANVSGAAAQTTNLSAVDAAAPATEPIDLGTGQQGSDEPLIQAGEDLPDSISEVPGAVASGGEFVEINGPTRPPEIRRAVSNTAQETLNVDIDRDIGRQTLQGVRSTGRDIVTGDFDAPDNSGLAGAAGIAVAAPEPVSTATGAAVLGGLALGGAITSIANNQAEIDVPEQSPASGFSEIDIGRTRQEIGEIDVPDRTPATDFGEVDIPDRATSSGEINVPDRTPASGTGEVDIPSIDAAQQVARGELVEEEEEEDDTILGEEDIPINPFDNPREQGSTPERFIREDRDTFVIRNPETTPEINQEQAQEPAVDETVSTGVGTGFGTGVGVGAGTEPIAPAGSDIDTRPGIDVGAGPETGTGIDTDAGIDTDVETGVDTRFETPTRQQTTTQNTFAQPTINETVPGFETGFDGVPNRSGRTRRPPRRPDLGVDPNETETAESPQFQSADDLFDSGILSGSEALDESFNR